MPPVHSDLGKSMTTVVIGAGIIGTAIAQDLQKRGRQVVLVDRDAPGKGASFGNMASTAVTEFMPASRPSVWKQIPGWLLDPEGPVRVRPSYMPKLVPWFLRFIAASRPSKLRELEAQGAALCARSLDDTLDLLREAGLSDQISAQGCLSLYTDEAEFKGDRDHIDILERFGVPHEVIGRQAIKALEPELSDKIGLAVLFPQNRTIKDHRRKARAGFVPLPHQPFLGGQRCPRRFVLSPVGAADRCSHCPRNALKGLRPCPDVSVGNLRDPGCRTRRRRARGRGAKPSRPSFSFDTQTEAFERWNESRCECVAKRSATGGSLRRATSCSTTFVSSQDDGLVRFLCVVPVSTQPSAAPRGVAQVTDMFHGFGCGGRI